MIKQLECERVSLAVVEPKLRMLNGVVLQAVSDLNSPDIVRAVDALCFWLSDESVFWLDAVGVEPEPDRVFYQVIDGAHHDKAQKHKFS